MLLPVGREMIKSILLPKMVIMLVVKVYMKRIWIISEFTTSDILQAAKVRVAVLAIWIVTK